MSGAQVVALLRTWKQQLQDEEQRLSGSERRSSEQRAAVAAEAAAAWDHLLALLLPSLDPAALNGAAALLGLPSVGAAAVAARRVTQEANLRSSRSALEAFPRFVGRATERNGIEIRLAGLRDLAATLETSTATLEAEPLFDELLATGYGTTAYAGRFWHLAHYRRWKRGDEIVEAHGPRLSVYTFEALRAKYLDERQARDTFRAELFALESALVELAALERRYEEAEQGLSHLDQWSLATARGLAREQLGGLSEGDLRALLGTDHALVTAAKRVSGTAAKTRYLEGLAGEWLGEHREELRRRSVKLARGIEKFSRAKHQSQTFDQAEIVAKYGPPDQSWSKRWQRYDQATQQIVVFQDYGSTPIADFLWWDHMTGHMPHAHFLEDEVYHRHRDVGGALGPSFGDRGSAPSFSTDAS
jgi:hypothetical protein